MPVLEKVGVGPDALRAKVNAALDALPTVSGDAAETARASNELVQALRSAEQQAGKLNDEYVSTEHLLLALTDLKAPAGEALREAGATTDALLQALAASTTAS